MAEAVSKEEIRRLLDEITDHFTKIEKKSLNQVLRGQKSKERFLDEVTVYLGLRGVSGGAAAQVLEEFQRYLWGYHILEDLINDDSISDIKVLSYDNIRIKRQGQRETAPVAFRDKEEYRQFVEYVAIKNRTNISDMNAVQNFTDKLSNEKFILRFNIVTDFVNSVDTPYLHIRKIPKHKRYMEELIALGMLNRETADYLVEKAKNGTGMLFTGKGASGKTTLMNALLDRIPHSASVLAIQENEELFSNTHPDMMFQHVVTSRGEGKLQYDLKELARNGLLTDLDYFIIGEIKGGEALYFLNASYTGHKCWASVHGISSTQAMDKLVDYIKYESDYAKEDVLKMLENMSCIVYMENFRVKEISEVTGYDAKTRSLNYRRVL